MTPKEKAQELYEKYYNIQGKIEWNTTTENKEKAENFNNELGEDVDLFWVELAKQSALIVVDEIVKEIDIIMLPNPFKQYWNKVKQEIKKL
jgi:hypothetical protein